MQTELQILKELITYLKMNMKDERLIDDKLMQGYLIALDNINKFYEIQTNKK